MSHTEGEDNHVKIIIAFNEKNSKKTTQKNLFEDTSYRNLCGFFRPPSILVFFSLGYDDICEGPYPNRYNNSSLHAHC